MAGTTDERKFIYRIDAANRIVFVNRDWLDFARENEAPELTAERVVGQPLERFIAGWEVRHLYELVYTRVRRTGREVRIPFSCDSPALRRAYLLRIVPRDAEALEFVVEAVRTEPLPPRPILDQRLERSAAIVVICSWCKRLHLDRYGWTAIEDAPEKGELFSPTPPRLSHGICPDCLATIRRQLDEAGR